MALEAPLKAKRRIFAIILLLGAFFGVMTWWIELESIDDRVVNMATSLLGPFAAEHLANEAAFSQSKETTRAAVLDHFKDAFPIVELYDSNHQKVFEYVDPKRDQLETELSKKRHSFPENSAPIYERMNIGKDAFVQVILPLQSNGRTYGYFEGVYDVPDEAIANIRANVLRSVLMIWLAVIVTGVALYPLLLALNRNLLKSAKEVLRGNLELLEVLGAVVALRDSDTNAHNYRVTWFAVRLGKAVGISLPQMQSLVVGAFLHDVGKIGTPDYILRKPGRLTDDEMKTMRQHVGLGVQTLSNSRWLNQARDVVENHHEMWDGAGYPNGVRCEDIPLTARIFAIVDVFDALISKRPYKEAFSLTYSLSIIESQSGSHFDPKLVESFMRIAEPIHIEARDASDEQLRSKLAEALETYFGIVSLAQ
jgi:putative nucleotidyltransferase with HDIG domain